MQLLSTEVNFLKASSRSDISLDLLEAASLRAREDAVKVLNKYALVTRRPAELVLDVYRLLVEVFPNDDHSNRKDSNEERLDLAWKCATSLYNDGRYKEAEELDVQVMQMRKRVLGDEHPNTLTSTNNLAFTLQSQARREEALALMEICVLGEQHHDTQSSLDTLHCWRAEYIDESL
ncbi:hypothetical protein GGP41_003446 [Bipolaris sorokiniana]|uniref:Kinesin light chain n=2 Tax=Cochliobolus sativus TaxID=45130 RepID=A0A8H5ZDE0_COCSA|nr:hypothetical protein GGP41_003446 [Bipolaris sorokiniana]